MYLPMYLPIRHIPVLLMHEGRPVGVLPLEAALGCLVRSTAPDTLSIHPAR